MAFDFGVWNTTGYHISGLIYRDLSRSEELPMMEGGRITIPNAAKSILLLGLKTMSIN
jgi:hypothetical protein